MENEYNPFPEDIKDDNPIEEDYNPYYDEDDESYWGNEEDFYTDLNQD